jgi:hypothetical protein
MPKEIVLDHLPAGYAKQGGRPNQEIDVVFREFCSTEDGQHFISRLEGTATAILEKISGHAGAAAATTSSLFAIIRPDRSTTVYWNEFHPVVQVRAKGKVNKGDLVLLDHIMDIERVVLPDGLVSNDAGICYVFSFGWRKGLFFDYGPLLHGDNRRARDYDLGLTLGYCYARVLFQHIFSISEDVWSEMFSQGWFPFSYVGTDLVKAMIGRAAEKLPIDDQLNEISAEVSKVLPSRLEDWKSDPIVSDHVEVLRRAYERFVANDHISASSILYPRIEGVMRTFGAVGYPGAGATQPDLSKLASGSGVIREESLLLPAKFEKYLREVYFASFKPGTIVDAASRNTVSHGVAAVACLDRKAATIGFLILMQIVSTILVTRKTAEP